MDIVWVVLGAMALFMAGGLFVVFVLCALFLGARPTPPVTDAEEQMAAEERLLELRDSA